MLMDILFAKETRASEHIELSVYRSNLMVLSGKVRLVLILEGWIELRMSDRK